MEENDSHRRKEDYFLISESKSSIENLYLSIPDSQGKQSVM